LLSQLLRDRLELVPLCMSYQDQGQLAANCYNCKEIAIAITHPEVGTQV